MDGNIGHLLLDPIYLTEWQKTLYRKGTTCIKIYKLPETKRVFTEGSRWADSPFVSVSSILNSVLYLNWLNLCLTSKDNHKQEHLYYITEYLALA